MLSMVFNGDGDGSKDHGEFTNYWVQQFSTHLGIVASFPFSDIFVSGAGVGSRSVVGRG